MANVFGPRNLGGIFGDIFRIYRKNFPTLLAIVAIVEVVLGLLIIVASPSDTTTERGTVIEFLSSFYLVGIILLVSSLTVYPLMQGALIHAISEQYLHQEIGIGRAYGFAFGRLGALIGALLLVALAIAGMGIMIAILIIVLQATTFEVAVILSAVLLAGSFYLIVRWIFFWQAVLLESRDPTGALSRSSSLVEGKWWRVFGILLVLGVLTSAISFSISWAIPVFGPTLGAILSTPIYAIGHTLLYFDLRVRKEGYSLETLGRELNIEVPSWNRGIRG